MIIHYSGNCNVTLCVIQNLVINQEKTNIFVTEFQHVTFIFTFSLINYLKEVLVVGVSVRWHMQTKFSRYYIFPYDLIYLLFFLSLSLVTNLLLSSLITLFLTIPRKNEEMLFLSLLFICGWPINLTTHEQFYCRNGIRKSKKYRK